MENLQNPVIVPSVVEHASLSAQVPPPQDALAEARASEVRSLLDGVTNE